MKGRKYCRMCGDKMIEITQTLFLRSFDPKTGEAKKDKRKFISCPSNKELNPFEGVTHDFFQIYERKTK